MKTIMINNFKFIRLSEKGCYFPASIIFCILLVIGGYTQNPVSWSLSGSKAVEARDKFQMSLSANISSGWYFYSLTQPSGGPNATRITVVLEPMFKPAGSIKAPPPKVKFDENFGINTETFAKIQLLQFLSWLPPKCKRETGN
jgi:hypothetical protein